ncbi:hypothetical protein [Janthinobacterium svalbardensis]|uniref:esterase/lipase family protein n=1 Tax=Janthinobacterium svalbardensis TaxID=368607 RepID=UPI002FCDC197
MTTALLEYFLKLHPLAIFIYSIISGLLIMIGLAINVIKTSLKKHRRGTIIHFGIYFATLAMAVPLITFGPLILLSIVMLNKISRKEVKEELSNTIEDGKIAIISVHGTFQPDATWAKEVHPLRDAINKKLHPAQPVFRNFIWSGANLSEERAAAGEKLGDLIRQYQEKNCCIHLIAHSHGGAVITKAMSGGEPVHSALFMATPFISLEKSSLPNLTQRSFYFGFVTTIAFLIAAISKIFIPWQQASLVFACFFSLSVFFLLFIPALKNKAAAPKPPFQADHSPADTTLNSENTRIFIFTGDEAGAILQFSSLFGSTIRKLITSLYNATQQLDESFASKSEHKKSSFFYMLSTIVFCILSALLLDILDTLGINQCWLLCASLIIIPLFGFYWASSKLSSGALSEYLSSFLLFHSSLFVISNAITKVAFGFSFKNAISEHEIIATSSETPIGKWVVEKYPFNNSNTMQLQHSEIYNDTNTLESMAQFILDRTPAAYLQSNSVS